MAVPTEGIEGILGLPRSYSSESQPPQSPSQQDQSFPGAYLRSCPIPISANMEVSGDPTVVQSGPKPSNEPVSRSNDIGQFLFLLPVRLRLLWRQPEAAEWFGSH